MRDTAGRRMTRRDIQREATHDSVLRAARRVFLSHGYDEATIKKVAVEAGVSPGTVLNARSSKAALLAGVLHEDFIRIGNAAAAAADAAGPDAAAKLKAGLAAMMQGFLEQAELFSALIAHRWLISDADFQQAPDGMDMAWNWARDVIDAAVRSGAFHAGLNRDAATGLLSDILTGAFMERCRHADRDPRAALAARLELAVTGFGGGRTGSGPAS